MTLRRIPTKWGHKYTLDGRPVRGVTTILDKGVPKPALPRWAATEAATYVADNLEAINALPDRESRIAVIKQAPWTARDQAAVRGTEVHGYAEQLVHGLDVQVPAELGGYVDGCARFLDDFGVQPILNEYVGANRRWWYAGTGDTVGHFDDDGEDHPIDWKTGSGIYAEVFLQLSGYKHFEFYLDEAGVEQPMPATSDIGYAVLLREDGQYFAHRYGIGDWQFKRFLYAKQIGDWSDAYKEMVGEPVHPTRQARLEVIP